MDVISNLASYLERWLTLSASIRETAIVLIQAGLNWLTKADSVCMYRNFTFVASNQHHQLILTHDRET